MNLISRPFKGAGVAARLLLSAPVLREAGLLVIFTLDAARRAVIEAASGADPRRTPVAAVPGRAEAHWAE